MTREAAELLAALEQLGVGARVDDTTNACWIDLRNEPAPSPETRSVRLDQMSILDLQITPALDTGELTDDVTGLPLRRAALGWLDELRRTPERAASVMCFDLNRFGRINDRWGTDAGDRAMRTLVSRLSAELGPGSRMARTDSDEFIIVLADHDQSAAERMASELAQVIAEPLTDPPVRVTASFGVAELRADAPAQVTVREVELALAQAKRTPRPVHVLLPIERNRLDATRTVTDEFRDALSDGSLAIHYQPVVWLDDGQVERYEALSRWTSSKGPVPPDIFIPLLEDMGWAPDLSTYLLDQVLGMLAERPDVEAVSINVSATELNPNLVERIEAALEWHRVAPERLGVELTETAVLSDPVAASNCLRELTERGVGVSIDDFGAGSTSLALLTQLPADTLKLDRSLIALEQGWQVVEAVVALGQRLGFRSVSEGIETDDDRRRAVDAGVDLGQGWHFGRPGPLPPPPDAN